MSIKLNMRGKLRCRLMIDRVLRRDLHMHLGNCSGLSMVEHCMCLAYLHAALRTK